MASDGTVTSVHDKLDPKEEFFAGLGQVGTNWGSQMSDVFDRENTVIVHSGEGLGILFLSDVTVPSDAG